MEDTVFQDIGGRVLSKEEDEVIAFEFTTHRAYSETYSTFARLERKYAPKPRETFLDLDRRAHA
jgi:hypothetical protein